MNIFKYKYSAFVLSLGLLTGCGNEFLEEAPADQVTADTFYKTKTDAIQAVTAAYSELTKAGQYNAALWGMDIMSDNSTTGGEGGTDGLEYTQLDNYSIPTTNKVATDLWHGCYIGLQRANIVLQRVPAIEEVDADTKAIKKRSLAEAHFLRAKYYFDLVRAFGDVPLFTTPPANVAETNIARSPQAEVYKVIEEDLKAAMADLPASYSGNDLGRATKWAAMGLLAKVYLTLGRKSEAADLAKIVIDTSGKSLWADYGDNFKEANDNGKESLFEVQYINGYNEYDQNNVGSSINQFWAPRNAAITSNGDGYGFNVPEPDFISGYEPGDKRKAVTVWVPGDLYPDGVTKQPSSLPGTPFGYNAKKFFVGKVKTRVWDSPLNIPVLRLAEMYLIVAEGRGNTPAGLEAINKVRTRAGLPNLTADTPDFMAAVMKERKYELAFEMDRWFDLKRTNTLIPVMTAQSALLAPLGVKRGVPTARNMVLPIPQAEIDANPNLTQNDY
jgi:hypothetical protein